MASSSSASNNLNLNESSKQRQNLNLIATNNNKNDRDHMALVLKNEEIANVFAMNNINLRQKIPLKHQFFILSLLEYICNLLNINDKNAAETQFKGNSIFIYFALIFLKEKEKFLHS